MKMKKFVAVQDMGLVINRKTASSQIYGAMIMGIAYALFEERIMDRQDRRVFECRGRPTIACRDWATSARWSSKSTSPIASAPAA